MTASAGKRILMLLENNPYSQDIRVKREARALLGAGYRVSVVCPKPPTPTALGEADRGIRLYEYPAPRGGRGVIGYAWEYGYSLLMMYVLTWIAFFREGFDVIHAHNPPDTMFLIAAVFKLFGKKFVFDHHDLSPEMFYVRFGVSPDHWMSRILFLNERLTYRLADHVIATNESYRDIAYERGGLPASRVTIVRNGPSESMQPVDEDPTLRRRAATILGYVGIMGPQDGVDYMLRAIHNLVYTLKYDEVFAVVIGKGDALPELRSLARELGIEDYVWFTEWISYDDLLRYLSTADICLDPDPSNPFNDRCTMIKMTEYMAFGKPIVAFDLPEHRVTAGQAALYAKGNDEMDFARKILELVHDPARRDEMGRIGRERIDTRLAWSFQKQNLLDAYSELFSASRMEVRSQNSRSSVGIE